MEAWKGIVNLPEAWDRGSHAPLLFVVCMEYLSRVLYKICELEQFQFNSRCKEMQLTHVCFADDIMLCYKGGFSSIYLLLQAFKLFSNTSDLQANVNKSTIYTCGMLEKDVRRITLNGAAY